ncbi:uncharacterized protein LOC117063520 [Trachypithecus francoisi]|uniref:uncharacterized protein LOC117063520 n=1 Tax=Trachypithecus francoisi TaxID=54180 RepID=UPI00141A91D4|nr:uncharacterized protein LOC117063520 [Trachypithecus francoisi]
MAGPAQAALFRAFRASVSHRGRMPQLGPDAPAGPGASLALPSPSGAESEVARGGGRLREERRQRGLEDPGSGAPGRLAWVGLSPSKDWDSQVLVRVDPGQAQDQVPLLPPRSAQRLTGALSRFTSSSFRKSHFQLDIWMNY